MRNHARSHTSSVMHGAVVRQRNRGNSGNGDGEDLDDCGLVPPDRSRRLICRPGMMPIAWTIILLASGLLLIGYRRRAPALAIPMMVALVLVIAACGGGGGSSSMKTPGTPAGTYTATITAKSGNLSHGAILTIIVQ